jgi:hypothetical protein
VNYVIFNGLAATASIADCGRDRRGFFVEQSTREAVVVRAGEALWMQFASDWAATKYDLSCPERRARSGDYKKSMNRRLALDSD